MKSIVSISATFEKVILKGFELADNSTQIKLFQATISLYHIDDTIFVYFSHTKSISNKNVVNIFEVKSVESHYLFDSIKTIIEDLDSYGSDANKQDASKIHLGVINFCKQVNFDYKDFEIALKKVTK